VTGGLARAIEVAVDLYEYQGRALFARHGLPVLDGGIATRPADVAEIARRLGGRVVVKAQVKTGGRGKAGGVQLARTPEEAKTRASEILGMRIKDHVVSVVMVTTTVDIVAEYYLAYLLDRSERRFLCIATTSGGVDIEKVARDTPERVVRVSIDPVRGVDLDRARELVDQAGFPTDVAEAVAELAKDLWQVFVQEDATLVEVNPLAKTADGVVVCLDAKVTLDDSAGFRHPDHDEFHDSEAIDPVERLARSRKLNYVKLDGQVGVIGNGAGLVMSTLDVVADAGARLGIRPANFLDIGGGASETVMADALATVLADGEVAAVLVNVFGGITACDTVANGMLRALDRLAGAGEPVDRPIVVRLDGNSAEAGRRILASANHPLVEQIDTMDAAARRVAELAAGRIGRTVTGPPAVLGAGRA
jgi:succinyl-CoA synthetase beta subunit